MIKYAVRLPIPTVSVRHSFPRMHSAAQAFRVDGTLREGGKLAQLRQVGVIRSALMTRRKAAKQRAEGAPDAWAEVSSLVRPRKSPRVAVGTTIADRPPHRSVQARLRIRLLPWMSGGETGIRIRMQNSGLGNPLLQERGETAPSHLCALTATD
jgi:hypothetical protein